MVTQTQYHFHAHVSLWPRHSLYDIRVAATFPRACEKSTFLPTMRSLGGQVTSLTGSTYNLRASSRRSVWASMDTVRRHATASHPPDTWDALPLIANNARMRAARRLAIPARILFVHLLARSTVTPSERGRGRDRCTENHSEPSSIGASTSSAGAIALNTRSVVCWRQTVWIEAKLGYLRRRTTQT